MATIRPKRRSGLDDLLQSAATLLSNAAFGGRRSPPAEPPPRARRLAFAEPCATTHECEVEKLTLEQKREVWWTSQDYGEIRARQRDLALLALRQARAAPPGTSPPPIPGESRRGLGVCCEPGTTAERARLVQRGREEVVRAHRQGMDPGALASLCRELSAWAAVNARDVATKDELDATGDSLDASLRRRPGAGPPAPPTPPRAGVSPASAKRALNAMDAEASPTKRPSFDESDPGAASGWLEGDPPDREAAPGIGLCAAEPADRQAAPGLGIASMVRSDSFGDLSLHGGP